MARPFPIYPTELQRRRVLFAVALTDPITGMLVSRGVRASVDQLVGGPIVNRSGHFVWLAEDGARPTTVTVIPEGAPYEPDSVRAAALPDPPPLDPEQHADPVDDSLRRQVIFLRPTTAYPFPDGATVMRGKLQESAAQGAPPIGNATVALEWLAEPQQLSDPPAWVRSFAVALTDARGEFAAALALPPGARLSAPAGKRIALRLRCGRAGAERVGDEIDLPPGANDPITSQRNTFLLKDPVAWDQLQPA